MMMKGTHKSSPGRAGRSRDHFRTLHGAIENKTARIGVVGLGYVGLPLALEFAKVGFEVVGVDLDETKVKSIREGKSYILDVPESDLRAVLKQGVLRATTNFEELRKTDAINICVPTPLKKTKDPEAWRDGSGVTAEGRTELSFSHAGSG